MTGGLLLMIVAQAHAHAGHRMAPGSPRQPPPSAARPLPPADAPRPARAPGGKGLPVNHAEHRMPADVPQQPTPQVTRAGSAVDVPHHPGRAEDGEAAPGDHGGHAAAGHAMPAMLGPYPMNREASGTAWQPDSSPVFATMAHAGDWTGMGQGFATVVHSDQGGPRGDAKTVVESMAMAMASRPVGAHGRLGLRAMVSLDPLMGRDGYPLLFATGETADGATKLVDRQHPHDVLMEIAASYSHDLGQGRAAFVYAGLPGEPALGPPTFMHRISGLDNPAAPIGHHWFDSTHITWGVVTAGYSTPRWKVEGSVFTGREPDQRRWNIERPRMDSWSVRAFWNPGANLSLQLSTGRLHSPEQLHPDEDEQRTTASATYNRRLGAGANWATTVAWSAKDLKPGPALTAWLAETLVRWADRHTVFARVERTDQAELFGEDDPLHHRIFPVNALSLGYQYELALVRDVRLAIGGLASGYGYGRALAPAYGGDGVKSAMLYARIVFGDRRIGR